MLENVTRFAQEQPLVSGLVVLGAAGLAWYAFGRGGSSDGGDAGANDLYYSGFTYQRPSDAEIGAAADIVTTQLQAGLAQQELEMQTLLGLTEIDAGTRIQLADLANQNVIANAELASVYAQRDVNFRTLETELAGRLFDTAATRDLGLAEVYANRDVLLYRDQTVRLNNQERNVIDYQAGAANAGLNFFRADTERGLGQQLASNDRYEIEQTGITDRLDITTGQQIANEQARLQYEAAREQARASRRRGFSLGFGNFRIGLNF